MAETGLAVLAVLGVLKAASMVPGLPASLPGLFTWILNGDYDGDDDDGGGGGDDVQQCNATPLIGRPDCEEGR